jgi:excisionase family DNA binding protein
VHDGGVTDDLIGTAEAAELLGVSLPTIKRKAQNGLLPVAHKMPGETGAYLFHRADVEALRVAS